MVVAICVYGPPETLARSIVYEIAPVIVVPSVRFVGATQVNFAQWIAVPEQFDCAAAVAGIVTENRATTHCPRAPCETMIPDGIANSTYSRTAPQTAPNRFMVLSSS